MGLFDSIINPILGSDAPKVKKSGAFSGLDELGGEFQDFLLTRLMRPVQATEQFKLGSAAIRDVVGQQGAAARQRLGDAATTGGFLDSGAVLTGLGDIERAGAETFASEITKLILGLEDRREQNVLPFLTAGANEALGVGTANQQASLQSTGQTMGFLTDLGLGQGNPISGLFG